MFTFSFNLITIDANGVEATYSVTATCSLPLPWSPREVSCEENYMEVLMHGSRLYPGLVEVGLCFYRRVLCYPVGVNEE